MRNLQEQVKKAFCYQKLFWPFSVWINCSSDLKILENCRPSASNFKSFSRSLEHFFQTVGQNNFGNEIHFPDSFIFQKKIRSQNCHNYFFFTKIVFWYFKHFFLFSISLGPPTNKAQKGIDFYFKSDGTKKTGNPSGGGGNPNKKAYKGKRIQWIFPC